MDRSTAHNGAILGLITARGGSKGIPGKNIRPLGGRPLIAWSVDAAQQSDYLDRVVVTTDCDSIREAAVRAGAEGPFLRPPELAQDDSPHIQCVLHALEWLETHQDYRPEAVCLLQPTSPLRTAQDIDAACAIFMSRRVDAVVSVCESEEHPFFAKTMTSNGRLVPFIEGGLAYNRRQALPPSFHINGAVYVNRVSALRRDQSFYPEDLYASIMPRERSLDINTPWDFRLAEILITENCL